MSRREERERQPWRVETPSMTRRRLMIEIACLVVALVFGGYELLERTLLLDRLDLQTRHLLHILRGVTAVAIMTAIAASQLFWRGAQQAGDPAMDVKLIDRGERRHAYLLWFIRMRWLAAACTLALIVVLTTTGVLEARAVPLLGSWFGMLVLANVVFTRWAERGGRNAELQMMTQVVVDLAILTGLLNASGGLANPLYVTYLFHIIIAGILLPKRKVVLVTGLAIALFSALVVGEMLHVLPHYTLSLFPRDPAAAVLHADGTNHAVHNTVFVAGRGVPFIGVLLLTAYFTVIVIERLRESEENLERAASQSMLERRRLESVIETAGLGLLVIDRNRRVVWSNQRARSSMPEACPGEVVAHTHDAPTCIACMVDRAFVTGELVDRDVRVGPIDSARHFRHACSPVRDQEGQVLQAVHLIEETTLRKELEAEALHAGKLAVLGQMAAGLAHEIGNPLSSLSTRLHLMKRRAGDADFIAESIELLKDQLDRIGRIVRGVSHFARSRQDEWMRWDVNHAVDEAVRLIRLDGRARAITIRERLDRSAPAVVGVKDQILQVIVNLLLNAVEAMPEGGTIEVETARRDSMALISVSDTGPGIDDAVIQRVFDPFYTTKQHGTGLGLSICQTLVHAHGGTIRVRSESGKGSRFTIVLPLSQHFEERPRYHEATA